MRDEGLARGRSARAVVQPVEAAVRGRRCARRAPGSTPATRARRSAQIKLGLLASPREFRQPGRAASRRPALARIYELYERQLAEDAGPRLRRPRTRRGAGAARGRRAQAALAGPLLAGAGRRVPGHRARPGAAGADPRGATGRLLLRRRRGSDAVRLAARQRPTNDRPRPRATRGFRRISLAHNYRCPRRSSTRRAG